VVPRQIKMPGKTILKKKGRKYSSNASDLRAGGICSK